MTRVIHTGDTHIGYQQYHSRERRADFLDAFRQVVDDAIAADVGAVVHAGDLFHDRRPSLSDLLGTIAVLDDLRTADVPFLAVVGNHEGTRGTQWLDLFERLGLATRLDASGTPVGNTTFYGLDFVPRSKRADLDYEFDPSGTEYAALVSHGLFTPFNTDWNLEAVLDASPVAFDAVLLGDDHQPDRAQVDGAWVTYCGSTERASAAERDERGYNLVAFDDGVNLTRRGLETRRFVFVDLELAADEGTDRVRQRIREERVEECVVIVTVEGDGREVVPAEIELFGDELGALVTRVNDRREREVAEEVVEVRFADPDEAVRERVRELGLSDVGRAIDVTVRDATVAKTNVRGTVEDRVRDLLDDPGSFRPASDASDESAADEDRPTVAATDGDPETDAVPDDDRPTTMEEFQ